MRIALTGATGFVGSHLAETLIRGGHEVTCLVRTTSSLRWLEGLDYTLRHVDLADPDSIRPALEGQQIVIHCAGLVRALRREEFFRVNADGARHVAQAAAEAAPDLRQFLLVSSLAAMGPSPDGRPVDETHPPDPRDAYGRSKLQGEREVLRFADRLPITIVRPSAVYGPRDRDVLRFFRAIRRHIRPVAGLGRRTLSLCHVSDIVQVVTRAIGNDKAIGETFLASTDRPLTWLALGKIVAEAMHTWTVLVPVPPPALLAVGALTEWTSRLTGRAQVLNLDKARMMLAPGWACDVSKARRLLGYVPRIDLASGVASTVQWYKEHGWL